MEIITRDFHQFILPGWAFHTRIESGLFLTFLYIGITHWAHPSFFAYFPSVGSLESLIGDIYAGGVSNPGFNVSRPCLNQIKLTNAHMQWVCSPASTELEAIIMDWSAKLFGLDDKFLTSSGVGGGVLQVGFLCSYFSVPSRLNHPSNRRRRQMLPCSPAWLGGHVTRNCTQKSVWTG